jgi:mannitol-1-phosphate/altronate dehydrogenase
MERQTMYKVPEEDRKIFLEYLAKKPYIEVAALVARIAAWTKSENKEKNGKDKPQ